MYDWHAMVPSPGCDLHTHLMLLYWIAGLLGLAGSADLRGILAMYANKEPKGTLALEMLVYRYVHTEPVNKMTCCADV